ncbi:MAG: hypothetical protein LBM06_04780 [Prevotellaceae bacterium]|jgi:hypothetical protein|nr:hypothetical protein [Prevotellaceae bacterium]
MKKVFFTLSMVAAMALATSCSNDEVANDPQLGQSAGIQIMLGGDLTAATRTLGEAPAAAVESTVNRIAVGLFASDGTKNVIAEFDGTVLQQDFTASGYKLKSPVIPCTAGTKQTLVIVANAPAGAFSAAANLKNFLEVSVGLDQTAVAYTGTAGATGLGIQTGGNLPMSGTVRSNSDPSVAFTAKTTLTTPQTIDITANTTVSKVVYLSRLASRIELTNVATNLSDGDFVLEDVFLHNAATTVPVDTAMMPQPATLVSTFFSGNGDVAQATGYAGTESLANYLNSLYDATGAAQTLSLPVEATAASHIYFYTLPNNNPYYVSTDANPSYCTKLVLKGTISNSAASDGTYYYPISINSEQGKLSNDGKPFIGNGQIFRNHQYKVKVTIKGKGTTSPDIDPATTAVEAVIYVDDWFDGGSQEVEFN